MKTKHLLVLAVVAILLGTLAWWSAARQRATPPAGLGQTLLTGLDLEKINRIEISSNNKSVTIVRGGDCWAVSDFFGFPADLEKITRDLLTLKELKVGDVQRGMTFGTNRVVKVSLQDASGHPLAVLRLGDYFRRAPTAQQPWMYPEGRYLAVNDDPKIYLVKETLNDFDTKPKAWVDDQLLAIPVADIRAIEMASPTGRVVTFSRETGALQMQGLAPNEEMDASKTYGLEYAFTRLTLAGVADPKISDVLTGLATPGVFRERLKNGDAITARIGSAAGISDRYVRFTVELAPAGTNAVQKADYEKRKADYAKKFDKWTYLIAANTADEMTRSRADLIKITNTTTNEPAVDAATPTTPGAK